MAEAAVEVVVDVDGEGADERDEGEVERSEGEPGFESKLVGEGSSAAGEKGASGDGAKAEAKEPTATGVASADGGQTRAVEGVERGEGLDRPPSSASAAAGAADNSAGAKTAQLSPSASSESSSSAGKNGLAPAGVGDPEKEARVEAEVDEGAVTGVGWRTAD
jgi:hypothetical protein